MTDQQRTWTIARVRAADPDQAGALEAAFTVADNLRLWRRDRPNVIPLTHARPPRLPAPKGAA